MWHRVSAGWLSVSLVMTLWLAACSDEDTTGSTPTAATTTGGGGSAGTTSTGTGGIGAAGGGGGTGGEGAGGPIAIPEPNEWTDQGEIFSAGSPGQWDLYLYGGFGGSVIRLGSTLVLYYQGADGYDTTEDTVTHRAIGAATSSDGLTFTKHAGNPVLSWLPNNGIEEGAASVGVCVAPSGEVVAYYGANTEISSSQVNADGRLATSSDGLVFTDVDVVLNHASGSVWGSGDELFPVACLPHGGQWLVYYIPNGSPERAQLGVAWGPAQDNLSSTGGVQAGSAPITAWGMAGWARLAVATFALFISDVQADTIYAYTTDPATPETATGPVTSYQFANMSQGTVYLDEQTDRWLLYYRNADASAWGVRTAPVRRQ